MPFLSARAASQHLFYCETSNNFYPNVPTCTVPWKEIDKAALSQPAPAPGQTQIASVAPPADTQATPHRVIAYPIGMPPPVQTPAAPAPVVLTPAVATIPGPTAEPAVAQGPVTFVYGADTTPTIVCAVSQVCDMALQPGETINHIILGDPDHWKIEPEDEGSGASTTLHLIIRPAAPDLDTSMIVLTKTRSYHVRLLSHRKDYMLQVAFSYPEPTAPAAAPAEQPEAALDSADGFVHVGGVTYVKGREPKALGGGKAAEPPPPAAAPRPEVSISP